MEFLDHGEVSRGVKGLQQSSMRGRIQMAPSATSPFGIGDEHGTVVTDCLISPWPCCDVHKMDKRTFDEEKGSVINNQI